MLINSVLDAQKSGLVQISAIFDRIGFHRSMYTDSLLELIDIDYTDGELNFPEFLDVILTYGMFERNEIFKCKLESFVHKAQSLSIQISSVTRT